MVGFKNISLIRIIRVRESVRYQNERVGYNINSNLGIVETFEWIIICEEQMSETQFEFPSALGTREAYRNTDVLKI